MGRQRTTCQEALGFLRANYGRTCLAPLTGQDAVALAAFTHLVELYARSDVSGQQAAVVAMSATVQAMQPSTRHLAKQAIPAVMDWSDEEHLWVRIRPWEDDEEDARGRDLVMGAASVLGARLLEWVRARTS